MNFRRAKRILGSKVNIESGVPIGVVEDIVFSDDGQIAYMVVANKGKLVSVPWSAAKFNFEQRQAMVAIAPEQYRRIPTFTPNEWPSFNDPQFHQRTHSFYNVPAPTRLGVRWGDNWVAPRQERRIENRVEKGRR